MVALRTLLFTLLVPGTVTVYLPYLILSSEDRPLPGGLGPVRFLGLVPIVLGAAFYLWCAWDFTFAGRGTPAPFDPPRELVVRGLYRYTRNPMYVGVLSVVLGEALLFASPALLVYAAVVFLFFHLFVVLYEELTLAARFGEAYEQYRRTVPRWLGRRRRPSHPHREPPAYPGGQGSAGDVSDPRR